MVRLCSHVPVPEAAIVIQYGSFQAIVGGWKPKVDHRSCNVFVGPEPIFKNSSAGTLSPGFECMQRLDGIVGPIRVQPKESRLGREPLHDPWIGSIDTYLAIHGTCDVGDEAPFKPRWMGEKYTVSPKLIFLCALRCEGSVPDESPVNAIKGLTRPASKVDSFEKVFQTVSL